MLAGAAGGASSHSDSPTPARKRSKTKKNCLGRRTAATLTVSPRHRRWHGWPAAQWATAPASAPPPLAQCSRPTRPHDLQPRTCAWGVAQPAPAPRRAWRGAASAPSLPHRIHPSCTCVITWAWLGTLCVRACGRAARWRRPRRSCTAVSHGRYVGPEWWGQGRRCCSMCTGKRNACTHVKPTAVNDIDLGSRARVTRQPQAQARRQVLEGRMPSLHHSPHSNRLASPGTEPGPGPHRKAGTALATPRWVLPVPSRCLAPPLPPKGPSCTSLGR